jgi:hypothetical protein
VESAPLRRTVALAVVAALLVLAVVWWRPWSGGPDGAVRSAPRLAPPGVRIRVEVINATRTRGLARRATFALRDAGFDVVRFATDTAQRDSTVVLDRSGHPDWARLVARALGGARVETRPDSLRYLDVSVLLGADWRPPAQPFYP